MAIAGGDAPAIEHVLREVPARAGLAYIVVSRSKDPPHSPLPVEPLDVPAKLVPDRVYFVPPDREVVLADGTLAPVSPTPQVRAPADRLMRSLADHLGGAAIGIILSGDGIDGAFGVKRIKEAGGLTLCQDPAQARHTAMPAAAIATGRVDLVLPLEAIPQELLRLASEPAEVPADTADNTEAMRDVLALVRLRSGHDFSAYKRTTLYRRILRRMDLCGSSSLAQYHRYALEHPAELGSLLRDLMISVTSFFRDPSSFELLERRVIPHLYAHKGTQDHMRVWVPACATGEEAYSLAISLVEYAETLAERPRIQVFASDIDESALALARGGLYPEAIALDVTPARLARYFDLEPSGYRVRKELRDIVLFSPHNVLRDPPFSRLDLVSCRNLLVYLERVAQERALGIFHFALRPDGYLMTGASETADTASGLFSSIDPHIRIFERRRGRSHAGLPTFTGRWMPPPATVEAGDRKPASFGEIHHKLVELYAPPSVLVNAELEVIHLSEHGGRFLEIPGGEPSRNLIELVIPPLRLDLRTAIYAARQPGQHSAQRIVRFDDNGKHRSVEIRARAVDNGMMLVLFDELELQDPGPAPILIPTARAMEPIVRELEAELHRTRDQLRAAVEQYETSLEELKASNEELQAINEELRAATEEVETREAELQSVNAELKRNVEQLARANSDVQNLIRSVDIGVLFLGRELEIKLFTPRARDLFHVIESDIGRPLAHLSHRLRFDGLLEVAGQVLATLRAVERHVESKDGRNYLLRILPYRSLEDRIEGVVLTFFDVTDLHLAETARQQTDQRFRLALRTAPIIATSQDRELRYTWSYTLGEEVRGGDAPSVLAGCADELDRLRRDAIDSKTSHHGELELAVDGQARVFDIQIEPAEGGGVTTVAFDVTASKQAETALRELDRRKDEFLATLSHELRNPLTPLRAALELQRLRPELVSDTHAIMERQVEQMVALVDELLDLARVTQGRVTLELASFDLREVVRGVVEVARAQLGGRDLVVELGDEPAPVRGDLGRLTQIARHLIDNATRTTGEDGHIRVEITIDREKGLARLRVRDDGMGIAPDQLPHMFEPFMQSRDDSGRARGGGLGVALSFVRKLVELHGGAVTARSEGSGKGSELDIELPLAAGDGRG